MDGDKVPHVWLSGYEVQVPDGGPWASVPRLYFGRDGRLIKLYCYWSALYSSNWAVPSFVRE